MNKVIITATVLTTIVTTGASASDPSDGQAILRLPGRSISRAPQGSAADILYKAPITSQYVGGTVDGRLPEFGIQVHPFGIPLEWSILSHISDATYVWSAEGLPVTDESNYGLAVTFPIPEVTDDGPYQMYQSPTLTAETSDGVISYIQATDIMVCGKPQIGDQNYGLLPFDPVSCGTYIHTVESSDGSGHDIPIFGYSAETDAFWRLYTCGGDEENFPNIAYAYVSGIINGFMPTSQPMVLKGAWLFAVGKVTEEARFTCSVYSLDEEGRFVEELASQSISGNDLLTINHLDDDMCYYSLPFTFDTPIVLDDKGTAGDFYAVMITGQHDGGIEYFAPVMQHKPNGFEECFGFYQIEFMYRGRHEVGLSFVANHTNDYGEMYCAFAINLDAEYPWLESETSEIVLDESPYVLHLNSYYPAEELSVILANGDTLPQWISVTAEGRYAESQLTFTASDLSPEIDTDIIIQALGVRKKLHLSKTAGINYIEAETGDAEELYDIMGRKIDAPRTKGIYILRSTDGSAQKVAVQ